MGSESPYQTFSRHKIWFLPTFFENQFICRTFFCKPSTYTFCKVVQKFVIIAVNGVSKDYAIWRLHKNAGTSSDKSHHRNLLEKNPEEALRVGVIWMCHAVKWISIYDEHCVKEGVGEETLELIFLYQSSLLNVVVHLTDRRVRRLNNLNKKFELKPHFISSLAYN